MKLRVTSGAMARILFIMLLASVFFALPPRSSALAQASNPEASAAPAPNLSVEERAVREAWRSSMIRKPAPRQGCFHLAYPNTEWQEAPCRTAPDRPYPMKSGLRMELGNGNTFVAQSQAGAISEAVGQFPVSATEGISETGAAGANDFSLQLNANQFPSPVCTPPGTTAKSDDCAGWEQFVYSNFGHGAFMQYWLIGYFDNRAACPVASDVEHGGCCPAGWNTFKPTTAIPGAAGCWRNSVATAPATPLITLNAEALLNMNLLGRVAANSDSFVLSTFDVAQDMYSGSGLGDPLGLNGAWKAAEFNVFGDANSSNASFSGGTTFNVLIDVGVDASCATPATGITGETNNLAQVRGDEGPCCTWTGTGGHSGVEFTQSNAAGARSICDAGDRCIRPGAACSATSAGCCAIGGEHVCSGGRCIPVVPLPSCNGKPRPTSACSSAWHCCDSWVCGQCQ